MARKPIGIGFRLGKSKVAVPFPVGSSGLELATAILLKRSSEATMPDQEPSPVMTRSLSGGTVEGCPCSMTTQFRGCETWSYGDSCSSCGRLATELCPMATSAMSVRLAPLGWRMFER